VIIQRHGFTGKSPYGEPAESTLSGQEAGPPADAASRFGKPKSAPNGKHGRSGETTAAEVPITECEQRIQEDYGRCGHIFSNEREIAAAMRCILPYFAKFAPQFLWRKPFINHEIYREMVCEFFTRHRPILK
jgi:hypothetical protein